ncbi:DUF222 domain-containing protein [Modestobacter sp. NPDC049651]|uniref:HNH endonuclease signature motif containing protein n=1 Tax=unclassified Modestobacter TaxID=2643866 RepID=UPI0033C87AFB
MFDPLATDLAPGPAYADAAARLLTATGAAWFVAAGGRVETADGEPSWFLDWDDGGEGTAAADEELVAVSTGLRSSLETGAGLLDEVRHEERVVAAAQARQARAVARFCRSRPATADRPDEEVGAAAAATRAARHPALLPVSEWAVDELSTALSVTSARAERLMVQSLLLTDRLPATLTALEAGALTWDHVAVLCEVLGPLSDDVRGDAETRVLRRLGTKTPTQLRAAAHRVVQRLDGQAITRRVEAALRERGVQVHPTGDGLGTLSLTNLPLPVLRAVQDALRQYADAAKVPGDERTRQQRMVDCMVGLVLRPGEHGLSPVQAQLTIIATVRTLLGGDDPGEVGGDVVPAAVVRALARTFGLLPVEDDELTATPPAAPEPAPPTEPDAPTEPPAQPKAERVDAERVDAERVDAERVDAERVDADAGRAVPGDTSATALRDLLWMRTLSGTALAERPHVALVDELTGQLLALTDATALRAGRALGPPPPTDAYEPTAELTRHLRQRDRRCRFPGCRRPGRRCDQHHLVRWPEGSTSAENMCCLCRHHHRLVHQAPGWQLHALTGGALRFTTPTGEVLISSPPGPDDDDPTVHRLGSPPTGPPADDPPPF